jgi:hypothetical protein
MSYRDSEPVTQYDVNTKTETASTVPSSSDITDP